MKQRLNLRILISAACGLIALGIFSIAAYSTYYYEIENHKTAAASEIELVTKELENLINTQVYKSKGLSSYYIQHPDASLEELHHYSEILFDDSISVLRSATLIKDTTIFFIHPIEGNEKALGADLSKVTGQSEDVLKVKSSLTTVVTGPVDLLQGGKGIIIRIPILSRMDSSKIHYLGQMSVVIDYDLLLKASKFNALMDKYSLQLIENNGSSIEKIIYSNTDSTFKDSKNYSLNLTNMKWVIKYAPKSGWNGSSTLLNMIVFIGLLTSLFVFLTVNRQLASKNDLNLLVDERTKALIQTNEYLEQTLGEVEEKQAELFILNDQLEHSLEHLESTQEQLIQSEKFAALGELVAGVAHEINTPLGIGITLATFVEDKHVRMSKLFEAGTLSKSDLVEYNDALNEALSVMVSSLNRSAEIISSFKNVAGEQSALELRYFNVREYFEDVIQNLRPKLKKTAHDIHLICDPEMTIYHYPGVFSHILTNFIVNSLTHGFTDQMAGHITIEMYKKEDHAILIYTDDGLGITNQHIAHVFDPFYTTKKGQGNTGLGLHIVHNIVTQNLNGKINLVTAANKGVCFTIEFPLVEPELFLETLAES